MHAYTAVQCAFPRDRVSGVEVEKKTKHRVGGESKLSSSSLRRHMFGFSNMASRFLKSHGLDSKQFAGTQSSVLSLEDVIQQTYVRRSPVRTVPCGHSGLPILSAKQTFHLRKYQNDAGASMFDDTGDCRGGMIIMPCGSGKTAVGCAILACQNKPFLILTTRYPEQWMQHICDAYDIARGTVMQLRSGTSSTELVSNHVVGVLATYQLYAARQHSSLSMLIELMLADGGIVILDEVHAAAATSYIKTVRRLRSRGIVCCGLTATLVREDDELPKLTRCIGDVRYEISRPVLVKTGHIMDVTCTNIIVPCSCKALLKGVAAAQIRSALTALAPEKMLVLSIVLESLSVARHHTIVFCDDLYCMELAFRKMMLLCASSLAMYGPINMHTPEAERLEAIRKFSSCEQACVLFISRTGDEALDIPNASATVIFWNQWRSRRQIVQRFGRISRPSQIQSVAYVILLDTHKELINSDHRDQYLKKHGFAPLNKRVADTDFGDAFRQRSASLNLHKEARQLLAQLLANAGTAAPQPAVLKARARNNPRMLKISKQVSRFSRDKTCQQKSFL